jgi:hypothetical protein
MVAARARMMSTGKFVAMLPKTFMRFSVDYLKPLPPGATAAPPPNNGITEPRTGAGP